MVQRYSETLDMLAMDDIYETLLQAYRDDVEKYTRSSKLTDAVRFILEHGWLMAGETGTATSSKPGTSSEFGIVPAGRRRSM